MNVRFSAVRNVSLSTAVSLIHCAKWSPLAFLEGVTGTMARLRSRHNVQHNFRWQSFKDLRRYGIQGKRQQPKN